MDARAHKCVLFTTLALFSSSALAAGQAPPGKTTNPTDLTNPANQPATDRNWSIGLGISTGPLVQLNSGGLASVSVFGAYGVAVERRLFGGLWGRLQGSLGYNSFTDRPVVGGETFSQHALSWQGGLGARVVLVELGHLNVSGLLMGSVSGSRITDTPQRGDSLSAGGDVGFSVGYRFGNSIALRLATNVGSLRWSRQRYSFTDSDGQFQRNEISAFNASLALSPSLELRFLF